ncbi:hypothetical protein SporoP37_01890 [Sporosarcina sp. P37]|uniref:GLUG motif-containing protein n=1 Tax=unclassified Sporosarcina TaxID=2647733 RepID=UPI000A17B196|nr:MULTISPECIES: GLUG motif-containing protein [unclassified Sporosarcina]ARK23566.1 hypothetical protein SporoP37_01890 [Sporosarcina sp. P37]PID18811.1 hypothetical protein CSV62_06860 [Sporosarcina sp. P35]
MANGNFGGGDGTASNPYLVEDAEDLHNVRNNLSAHYKQIKNINMRNWGNWEPIGDEYNYIAFTGTYDGNGRELSNLKIVSPDRDGVGLFAYAENPIFKNINVSNAEITGGSNVGGILGSADGATIQNCTVSGKITGVGSKVGGILGFCYNYEGMIDILKCDAKANITCAYVGGGIVGAFYGGTQGFRLSQCIFIGNITGNPEDLPHTIGGIIGDASDRGAISDCYAKVNLRASEGCGGIAGDSQAVISRCVATGSVSSISDCAGIIGLARDIAATFDSYALLDSVTALPGPRWPPDYDDYFGDITGEDYYNSYISDAYSLITMENRNLITIRGLPITEEDAKKKSHYIDRGFDFENVWDIREGKSYPFLRRDKTKSRTKCERIAINKLLGGY